MRKRINQAKANYEKNTGRKLTDIEIATYLFPDMTAGSRKVAFFKLKKEVRKIGYDEMLLLARLLKCTAGFLNGSENYSFIH